MSLLLAESWTPLHTCPDLDLWLLFPNPLRSADPAHRTAQISDHSPRCPSSP